MTKQKLVIASNNAHKLEEINHYLGSDYEIISLQNLGFEGDIEEYGSTIEQNSLIKAEFIFEKYGLDCLADDSGLEVTALNNEPGVDSAHYAGPHRSHDDNMNLLLQNLKDKSDYSARFKTVLTLIKNGEINQFEGLVNGTIIFEKKGSEGFGYDPIFVPDGYTTTFAEMTIAQKNTLSHRANAMKKLVEFLQK